MSAKELLVACRTNDRLLLLSCLERGADVCATDDEGRTALHLAALSGSTDLVSLLLQRKADAAAVDDELRQPLHLAAARGHAAAAGALLAGGADANAATRTGQTALHCAAAAGSAGTAVASLLLGKGANPLLADVEKRLPLHAACAQGAADLVRLLADPSIINAADGKGATPLHLAAAAGSTEAVALLLARGGDVRARDAASLTPLLAAAEKGHAAACRALVDAGADPRARTGERAGSRPALLLAAASGSLPAVRLLLDAGAASDDADALRRSALHAACEGGGADVVRFLVEARGADIRAACLERRAALHYAARGGHAPVLTYLLSCGADVHGRDKDQRTPLHHAAACGRREAAALLIAKGADANAPDESRRSPLHLAAAAGHAPVAQLLIEHGARIGAFDGLLCSPLHMAAKHGHVEVAKVLCGAGANVNASPPASARALLADGGEASPASPAARAAAAVSGVALDYPPLYLAVVHNRAAVASFLLSRGADAGFVDPQGQPLVHVAAKGGHVEALRALVEGGADLASLNASNHTALQVALLAEKHDCASQLLAAKAPVRNYAPEWREAAVFLALAARAPDVFRVVVERGGADPLSPEEQALLIYGSLEAGPKFEPAACHLIRRCKEALALSGQLFLHQAARHGCARAVQALLASPACDLAALDADGKRAEEVAAEAGHERCRRLLAEARRAARLYRGRYRLHGHATPAAPRPAPPAAAAEPPAPAKMDAARAAAKLAAAAALAAHTTPRRGGGGGGGATTPDAALQRSGPGSPARPPREPSSAASTARTGAEVPSPTGRASELAIAATDVQRGTRVTLRLFGRRSDWEIESYALQMLQGEHAAEVSDAFEDRDAFPDRPFALVTEAPDEWLTDFAARRRGDVARGEAAAVAFALASLLSRLRQQGYVHGFLSAAQIGRAPSGVWKIYRVCTPGPLRKRGERLPCELPPLLPEPGPAPHAPLPVALSAFVPAAPPAALSASHSSLRASLADGLPPPWPAAPLLPEAARLQAAGRPEALRADHAADVFRVGHILAELLTGRPLLPRAAAGPAPSPAPRSGLARRPSTDGDASAPSSAASSPRLHPRSPPAAPAPPPLAPVPPFAPLSAADLHAAYGALASPAPLRLAEGEEGALDDDQRAFVEALLAKDPAARPAADRLLAHSFFAGADAEPGPLPGPPAARSLAASQAATPTAGLSRRDSHGSLASLATGGGGGGGGGVRAADVASALAKSPGVLERLRALEGERAEWERERAALAAEVANLERQAREREKKTGALEEQARAWEDQCNLIRNELLSREGALDATREEVHLLRARLMNSENDVAHLTQQVRALEAAARERGGLAGLLPAGILDSLLGASAAGTCLPSFGSGRGPPGGEPQGAAASAAAAILALGVCGSPAKGPPPVPASPAGPSTPLPAGPHSPPPATPHSPQPGFIAPRASPSAPPSASNTWRGVALEMGQTAPASGPGWASGRPQPRPPGPQGPPPSGALGPRTPPNAVRVGGPPFGGAMSPHVPPPAAPHLPTPPPHVTGGPMYLPAGAPVAGGIPDIPVPYYEGGYGPAGPIPRTYGQHGH